MIEIPTVLVLGAGASMPVGYPSGQQLFDKIINSLRGGGHKIVAMDRMGHKEDKVRAFANALFRSGQKSVDAFLEHRPDLEKIGKAAIAQVLIECESEGELYNPAEGEGNWYKYLFERMNTSFEEFGRNRLSVVTYNYDRSLEQFLCVSLGNSHGKGSEECAEKVGQIPVVHLHGRLGWLPWQCEGNFQREYAPGVTAAQIAKSATFIKIIHESVDQDPEFVHAHKLMSEAKRIYFLGFGYNEMNVRRLRLGDLPGPKEISGTCLGLTRKEVAEKQKLLIQGMMETYRGRVQLSNREYDIVSFFREQVHL